MTEEFFDRLKANDPAAASEPDLTRIKARVDAHTSDNVLPFGKRSQYARGLRVAAAVGVLALAGGVGFASGNATGRHTPESLISSVAPGADKAAGTNMGLRPTSGMGVGGDVAAQSSPKMAGNYMGYGGNVVLNPGASVTNTAGTAWSYAYSLDGVNLKALAQSLADAVGFQDANITNVDGSYQVNDNSGAYPYVGNDAMASYNAYANTASPWNCDQGLATPAKDGSVNVTPDMTAKCDQDWVAPSKADAIAAAKAAFAKLGLDGLKGARYVAYNYSTRSTTVNVTPSIDGMDLSAMWSAEVSKNGVFSISGAAANVVKAQSYPTVGARDAALRSALRKWQSFGPQQVWAPQQTSAPDQSGSATAMPVPTTPQHNGKPMVQAYVSDVTVHGAERALMQVYLSGGEVMLMPAWNFTAEDGSIWQMLAITDEYVDWTQPVYSGPIAYDAKSSGGGVASSSAVAPPIKR